MRNLSDKIAWITGVGGGIGEASAMALAASGAHVVLSGRLRGQNCPLIMDTDWAVASNAYQAR